MTEYIFVFLALIRYEISIYSQNVQIHYLGHSAFVLTFDKITVVTDYGKPNAWKEWGWDSPIHDMRFNSGCNGLFSFA